MKPFQNLALSAFLLVLLLSACSGATLDEISGPEASVGKPEPANTPLPPTPQISEIERAPADNTTQVPRELVEKTIVGLAEYLDIKADEIRVAESIATNWPDASLGCPQPDMAYATVITPGYWIVLEADEMKYPYHTDQADNIILCLGNSSDAEAGERPQPVFPVNPDEIDDGFPWVPVD